ncbi:MAG: hypothetical protein O2854_09555 [Chloroflexi bacterium]|nr:hypothetical protein [Chloroflexota bacterium]
MTNLTDKMLDLANESKQRDALLDDMEAAALTAKARCEGHASRIAELETENAELRNRLHVADTDYLVDEYLYVPDGQASAPLTRTDSDIVIGQIRRRDRKITALEVALAASEAALKRVVSVGHNDDCIFCGQGQGCEGRRVQSRDRRPTGGRW